MAANKKAAAAEPKTTQETPAATEETQEMQTAAETTQETPDSVEQTAEKKETPESKEPAASGDVNVTAIQRYSDLQLNKVVEVGETFTVDAARAAQLKGLLLVK